MTELSIVKHVSKPQHTGGHLASLISCREKTKTKIVTESDSANCEIHWDGVNINNWRNELNLFSRCRRQQPLVFKASRGLISLYLKRARF